MCGSGPDRESPFRVCFSTRKHPSRGTMCLRLTLTPGTLTAGMGRHENTIGDVGERGREREKPQKARCVYCDRVRRELRRGLRESWKPVVPLASHATIGPSLCVRPDSAVVAVASSGAKHTAHQLRHSCVQSWQVVGDYSARLARGVCQVPWLLLIKENDRWCASRINDGEESRLQVLSVARKISVWVEKKNRSKVLNKSQNMLEPKE